MPAVKKSQIIILKTSMQKYFSGAATAGAAVPAAVPANLSTDLRDGAADCDPLPAVLVLLLWMQHWLLSVRLFLLPALRRRLSLLSVQIHMVARETSPLNKEVLPVPRDVVTPS